MAQVELPGSDGKLYVRLTYSTGQGTFTVSKIEGKYGYNAYWGSPQTLTLSYGGGSVGIYCRSTNFKTSSYGSFDCDLPVTISEVSGTHSVSLFVPRTKSSSGTNITFSGGSIYVEPAKSPAPTNVSINPVGDSRTSINLNRNWNNATYCHYNINDWGWIAEGTSYSNGVYCNGNSVTNLSPNTTYSCQIRMGNGNSDLSYSSKINATTLGNSPTANSLSVSSVARTSASLSISASYDTNASYSSAEYSYGTTTSYGTSTGSSMTGLTPNTTYYVRGRVKDNWGRRSGYVTNSFTTTGNAPTISSHGVETYGQTNVTMAYSATYDTNDSLSSYKWEYGTSTSYGTTVSNSNSITDLTPNTTYYYKLSITSSKGRTSTATGTFKTDVETQQLIMVEQDITESSITGIIQFTSPQDVSMYIVWIYDGEVEINSLVKSTDIAISNTFMFEDLEPGVTYRVVAQAITKTQNASGGYPSAQKEMLVTTIDSSPVCIINSNGEIKRHKMYVMGRGNIYNPNTIEWQNGYYATGTIGQSLSLTQSTEINGGAACSVNYVEILPNISYTITNNDEVEFVIHGTDINNQITTVGYTISPGVSYTYMGTPDTKRMWISIKSSTNPTVNYATAKFFKLSIFRVVNQTLIPKDNIVYINGKIRYIDIYQAGESTDYISKVVALKVFDSSGNDIALGKTVTLIKGKNGADLQYITNGNTDSDNFASATGKTDTNLETIFRVDLGQDYTDIDHVVLWRPYSNNEHYIDTRLYGRDTTTRLTWKFQDYKIQGEYTETQDGYSAYITHENVEGVPMIISILQQPDNSTNTIVGTKIIINADWVASIPPVLDSWISYRTDAILAANQGRLLKNEIGNLSELTTQDKSSLVAAINEIWEDYNGTDEYTNMLNAILNAVLNR